MKSSPQTTRESPAHSQGPVRERPPSRGRRSKRPTYRPAAAPRSPSECAGIATAQEALARFSAMGDSERKYLLGYAGSLIWKTTFSEPLDLLHEALDLTLAGRRKWPFRVAFPVYMASAMRSVACARRNRDEAQRAVDIDLDAAFECGAGGMSSPSAEDEAIAREELRLWARAVDAAMELLSATDALAHGVLCGLVDGGKAKDLRAALQIDDGQLDAARKRVLRTLRRSARV